MQSLTIRKAGRTDLAALVSLEGEVFASDWLSLRSFRPDERPGYRLLGRVAGYYADGGDALRYERRVDDGTENRSASPEEDRSPRDSRATLAYMNQSVRPDFALAAPAGATADQFRPPPR